MLQIWQVQTIYLKATTRKGGKKTLTQCGIFQWLFDVPRASRQLKSVWTFTSDLCRTNRQDRKQSHIKQHQIKHSEPSG